MSFWGSLVAFLKLQELLNKNVERALVRSAKLFQASNVALLIAAVADRRLHRGARRSR